MKRKERQQDNRKRRTEILDWLSREATMVEKQRLNDTPVDVSEPATNQRRKMNKDYANQ